MSVAAWIAAAALAAAAGRLILWTILRRGSAHASTLEAVRDVYGAVVEYCVAPLGISCRGHVLVYHAGERDIDKDLLRRLRGLEPMEVLELLRAEGLRAELMPGVAGPRAARSAPALVLRARSRRRTAD